MSNNNPTARPEFKVGAGSVGTTAAQLSDLGFKAYDKVKIKAGLTNAGTVFVGHNNGVTTSNGYPIDAGEVVEVEVDDVSKIWVIADQADQDFSWIVV